MRIIKVKNYEELSLAAADLIGAQLLLKPRSVLGLATGSTPIGAYQILAERCREGRLDFSGISSVNLDEYIGLPAEHEQSYAHFMRSRLFDHVNINLGNTHISDGTAADLEAECARYDRLVEELGGIDLQLLGVGNNGHIGFNEPGDHFLAPTHPVELAESTREANKRFFPSLEETPARAVTLGMKGIFGARRVLLLASGAGKAEAVRGLICGPVTARLPASILALHPDFILLADEDALSLSPAL